MATAASPRPRSDMANTLMKAKSASHLPKVTMSLGTPPRGRIHLDSDLNTLPDPRSPSPAPRTPANDSRHPDLSNEVAMLSTKLINAINHQTNLDDSLQQTRHELEATKRKLAESEAQCEDYSSMITSGVLVKKAEAEALVQTMREELAEAQKQQDAAEKSRKEMEVELENLTSALFEEANTMVAAARKESEATERKNAQLRAQLNDTELLLASQQEQLADLKNVMERMNSERDESETVPRPSTAPSTPGHDTSHKMSHIFDNIPMSPNSPVFNEYPPDQPLRFSHLITPIMRNDVQAYNDFAEFLKSSRAAAPVHSRDSSGAAFVNGHASDSSTPLASSSPNVPGSFSSGATSSPRETSYSASLPALKDNKFFKRCLVEDIEPALRLDLAPGLSWLARRTVISAITNGSLVVEPFIPQSRFFGNVYACSLCGESRRTEAHTRRHRFRTSEDDSAQRYPLCEYCLGRIRATCDFLGFLRMVRDGLWRARTDDDIIGAWEESVRLREKMFWARLGGGVVPCAASRNDSPAVPPRRAPGGLLRRTSTDFTNITSITEMSRADEGISSADLPIKTEDIPRLRDPSASRGQEAGQPVNDDAANIERHDFANVETVQPERPSTPLTQTSNNILHDHLDGPATPKSQTSITEPSHPPTMDEDGPATPKSQMSITEPSYPAPKVEDDPATPKSQMSITESSHLSTEDNNGPAGQDEIPDIPLNSTEQTEAASAIPGSFD